MAAIFSIVDFLKRQNEWAVPPASDGMSLEVLQANYGKIRANLADWNEVLQNATDAATVNLFSQLVPAYENYWREYYTAIAKKTGATVTDPPDPWASDQPQQDDPGEIPEPVPPSEKKSFPVLIALAGIALVLILKNKTA